MVSKEIVLCHKVQEGVGGTRTCESSYANRKTDSSSRGNGKSMEGLKQKDAEPNVHL